MGELIQLLQETYTEHLYQVILSNSKDREAILKIKVRPVMIKDNLFFQETRYIGTKVFHDNFTAQEMVQRTAKELEEHFKQVEIETSLFKAVVLISKKGKITINKSRIQQAKEDIPIDFSTLSHNRTKKYILEEGIVVPFLVDLGVQTPDGKIAKSKYDKFRQINRYLEFVKDILPALDTTKTIRIIDFGCGKSYLTFALYYYLHEMLHYDLSVIGLDLKDDVIRTCNKLKEKYGYESLRFIRGDIASFSDTDGVDMVVSLHACDTATDFALEKAVLWNAKVIFAVPCCQHEVNRQIAAKELEPVLKYGIIKERMAALFTDAIRANILEEQGYDTQILEFIDMEHTPKNLLIRAIKSAPKAVQGNTEERLAMENLLHVKTTLEKQLYEKQ